VFAFPVFVNISKSWSWFGNMLLHSGKWGSGDANLIELQLVPQRLLALYKIDKNLFFLLGLGFIAYILTYFLPSLKNSISLKPKKRALLAVILALFFSILLITKHFANHYFIPNLVFKAFLLFLVTNIIISFIKNNRVENFIALAVFLIAIGFNIPQIGQLKASVKQKQLLAAEFEERERVLSTFNNKENILIISPHYRGSPFIQSAMAGGFMLSGQLRSTYKQKLIEKFPTTIMFVTWSDQFYLWDEFLDANEFIDPNNPVYIFIGEGKENHLKIIFDRISKHLPNCKVVTELLFRFEEPNEYFYKMSFLPKEKKILDKS
jgi:hypothetical protein